jgi:hypothetical protein
MHMLIQCFQNSYNSTIFWDTVVDFKKLGTLTSPRIILNKVADQCWTNLWKWSGSVSWTRLGSSICESIGSTYMGLYSYVKQTLNFIYHAGKRVLTTRFFWARHVSCTFKLLLPTSMCFFLKQLKSISIEFEAGNIRIRIRIFQNLR